MAMLKGENLEWHDGLHEGKTAKKPHPLMNLPSQAIAIPTPQIPLLSLGLSNAPKPAVHL